MEGTESTTVFRCPICETPAPSIAACKIHVSRCNDARHWGYVGDDLHDEIENHQILSDRGILGELRYLLSPRLLLRRTGRVAAIRFRR